MHFKTFTQPLKALGYAGKTMFAMLLTGICLFISTYQVYAQTPTLGVYANTSIIAGQNATITPSVAPTNTTSVTGYTHTNFTGVIAVDPATGKVKVTNAKQAGTYTITVKAFNGTASATTTFTLTVTKPACNPGNFTAITPVTVGLNPTSVAIGDFNGDGKQDIATTNREGNSVSIRLGDGLGGFTGTTNISLGAFGRSVAVGDFNGDGKQDIVALSQSPYVYIGLGDGLGGFTGTANLLLSNTNAAVAVGDFNGDGKQDIAVLSNGSSGLIFVRLGDGAGGFTGTTIVGLGTGANSIAVGDFNGDGKQDIAATDFNANTVFIRLGDGLGGFTGTTNVPTGTRSYDVAIGDFNGDGKQDIASANFGANTVSIRLGDGAGGFTGTTNVPVGAAPTSVAVGDFNGDGKQDIATANYNNANTVSIRLGDGLGGFTGTSDVPAGTNPRLLAVGDFNGDGLQDIAATNYGTSSISVSVLLAKANQINVLGNSTTITDGDATPSATDHTDFGSVNVGNNLVRTYTVQNTGAEPLTVSGITVTGGDASLFTVGALTPASPIPASGSATFTVTFAPASAGLKATTVHIANNDCNEADYDFAIQGTGISSSVPALGTYPNTSVTAGQNTTITPNVAPTNTTSVTGYTHTNFTGVIAVDPATGKVTITDAKQAGTYTITVQAFKGTASATTTFTLTVTNPTCSQGNFTTATPVFVGTGPYSVAVGDFNGDGNQDIATANNSANTVSIRLGDGLGGFTGITDVTVGLSPYSVAVGDFNGDGKQDIAVANNNSNTVSIRLGDGLGGFTGTTNVPVGFNPRSVALGDFNGDGKQDIAVANYSSNTVSILLGDGAGGFAGTTNVPVGTNPQSVAVGDFNGDGKQDIAVANNRANTVSIRLGDGLGGFTGSTNIPVGYSPYSVAIGDFNSDGFQDITTANADFYSNTVSIRLGNGSGGFTGTTEIPVGTTRSVAIGDFNGDGKQDIAAAVFPNTVSIRLGDGLGGFTGTTNVTVGTAPRSLAVGDFNGDGLQDIAAGNSEANTVSILLGALNMINVQGSGTTITDGDATPSVTDHTDYGNAFTGDYPVRTYTIQNTGTGPLTVTGITIIGGDATMFTVSAITPASPIPASGSATFNVTFSPTSTGLKATMVHIANDDCDEKDYDFAIQGTGIAPAVPVLDSYTNTTVTAGQNITITPEALPTNTRSITGYTHTSFTGVIKVDPATGVVRVTDAKQAGIYTITVKAFNYSATATTTFTLTVTNPICSPANFTAATDVSSELGPISVAIGDFNGDGKQDMAAANFSSNSVSIRLGNGLGGFSGATNVSVGTAPATVAVGDFNGDGKQDIATANFNAASVSIRLGDGLGGFSGTTNVPVGTSPQSVAVGDFNGDGKQDIAVSNVGSTNVSIRLGNGLGGFTGTTSIPVGTTPRSIIVGDFNGDGKQDIATGNFGSSTVSIRMGDGLGGFSGSTEVPVGTNPRLIALGDFNGDGKQDIAAANNAANTVSIRLGDGLGGFTGTTEVPVGTGPFSVAIGDFNGDGKQDFTAANFTDNTISIRLGDGLGGFSGTTNIPVGTNPRSVAVGDFNGDGLQDIAAANFGANTVAVLLNAANEINVQGNSTTIADGDITPSATDHTDFGNVNSGNNLVRTYTIQNTGTVPLTVSGVSVSGGDASLFTVGALTPASPIPAAGSATFTVTFAPASTGLKATTVHIANNDCNEADYDFAIQGTGTETGNSGGITWTGTVNNLWNEPGNWDLNRIPVVGDVISIPLGTPQLNIDFTAGGSLTISGTGTLAIMPNKILTISGTADFGGKAVTVQSTADGSGAIGQITGTLTGATNVTVERYIPSFRAYRLLAPSVNSTLPIRGNWQEGGNNPDVSTNVDLAPGFGMHITGSATGANGFDATQTGNPTIYTYQYSGTPGYTPLANTNVLQLDAKTGYLSFVRGNRTQFTNITTNTETNATTLRSTGTLLTGDVAYPLQPADQFTLVTNPYASAIDWAAIRAGNPSTVKSSYTYVDPRVGTRGGYVTVTGGIPTPSAGINATNDIQAGQSFFVNTSSLATGSPVLTIKEAHKATDNNNQVFRSGSQEVLGINLFFNKSGTHTIADGVTVLFNNNYSANVDDDDVEQIANFDEDIAIKRAGKMLVVEGRPLVDNVDTIYINQARLKVQTYELEFVPGVFNAANLLAYLQDSYLNIETQVYLDQKTIVPFTVTTDAESARADRFRVVFRTIGVLPVNFTNVKAFEKGNTIQVEWNMGNELNVQQYEIEKSADGRSFAKGGTKAVRTIQSTDSYQWLDQQPVTGNNYYRIKAIEKSGTYKYSQVVNVQLGRGNSGVTAYPNPVKGNQFSVQLVNQPKGKYSIQLHNSLGQEVYRSELNHIGGSATETVQLTSATGKGVYQLKVTNGTNITNRKIVVE